MSIALTKHDTKIQRKHSRYVHRQGHIHTCVYINGIDHTVSTLVILCGSTELYTHVTYMLLHQGLVVKGYDVSKI